MPEETVQKRFTGGSQALRMSPRQGTKRLQDKFPARRTEPQQRAPELQIFSQTLNTYRRETLRQARKWESCANRLSTTYEQLQFLHECRKNRILPPCVRYRPPVNNPQARDTARQNGLRMIQVMITDAHSRLHKYRQEIARQKSLISKTTNQEWTRTTEQAVTIGQNRTTHRKKTALKEKTAKLTHKEEDTTTHTWVRNLSHRQLTDTERTILAKGLNYNHRDAKTADFLAALEYTLRNNGLTEKTQQTVRQSIVPLITRKRQTHNLNTKEREALKSLRNDKNIIILTTDKGRMTVILDKAEKMQKAQQLLADTNTYQKKEFDPTPQLPNRINNTLRNLQKNGQITRSDLQRMEPESNNTPRSYGLPKVHKPDITLRPIVSLPGTPSHKLAKELQQKLKHLISGSRQSIQSTQEFLDIIRNIHIDKEETMISFDVMALFTSIDTTLAKETIANLLDRHNRQQDVEPINKDGILKLQDLCLTTHFTFNTQIYKQINGTPMGSPISGLIAEAVMQRLEQTVLPQIQAKLWVRYVDDTVAIIKNTEIENTHQIINATLTGIRFTREEEKDNQLPFLDVMVQRTPNGEFTTKVYSKATHTDQVLNYESNHPNTHKRSCIRTLFKRAATHCSTPELPKEEEEPTYTKYSSKTYTLAISSTNA
ncbi:uncharacterized protein [Chiloscyllium punctatum]|uniref:uncharacterized protein isoform X1 n=1 Tax=Chiloscyllium punctatum TaxID=137246 RepID=UPI003B636159